MKWRSKAEKRCEKCSKVAAVVGTVIFIGTFFPYYAVQGATKSHGGKVGASLLAPVAGVFVTWAPGG